MSYPIPNYTQIPNALLDDHMPSMKEAELKVTLAVARATIGWQKESDTLSLSQLQERTGMSRQGVLNGIEKGVERGTIERKKAGSSHCYSLHIASQRSRLVNEVDQLASQRSRPEVVNEVDRQLVNEVDTQKKELKEKKERVTHARTREASNDGPPPSPPVSSSDEYLPGLKQPVRRTQQVADGFTQDFKKLGIEPSEAKQLVDSVLAASGLTALVDAGDDFALKKAKESGLLLARMGYTSPETIRGLAQSWQQQNNWRDTLPKPHELAAYASQKQPQKPEKRERKRVIILNQYTGQREERWMD